MLDLNRLTLGEIAFIEDSTGLSISKISDDDSPKARMMAAMACVAKRRNGEPNFTFKQALELTQDEFSELLGVVEDEDA